MISNFGNFKRGNSRQNNMYNIFWKNIRQMAKTGHRKDADW
jgi:hypothetical protein